MNFCAKMNIVFVIIALATLTQLSGSASLKFFITRDLHSTVVLPNTTWTLVEVTTTTDEVTVAFLIPKDLSYSGQRMLCARESMIGAILKRHHRKENGYQTHNETRLLLKTSYLFPFVCSFGDKLDFKRNKFKNGFPMLREFFWTSLTKAVIFFANDTKALLQVNLEKAVKAKFYSAPYNLINEVEGKETTKDENDGFCAIFSSFPRAWLPEKWNKVSAAIIGLDGRYFNYYRLQNFQISLPDLMVVEEYMKIPDSVKD